jgi:putative Flp pilus-assembly TadE/G-like protein
MRSRPLSSTTSLRREGERGQVLVLFAGGLLALLVIAALAFDVGMMLVERRDEQDAADAAALAGARYVLTDQAAAQTAAFDIAAMNGYSNSDPNEVVNVYIPPLHGRYVGLPGFIEVQIQSTRPSIFGGVIGRANWPIGAMGVATNSQNLTFPFSMLALNPTACKSIAVSGGGVVEAYANIQSNSNGSGCTGDDIGFSRTGGSTINVVAPDATCRVVGTMQDQGSGSMTCTVVENSYALPDPLRNLPAPVMPALALPMDPVGHTKTAPDYCPGATGSKAPSVTQPRACDVGGNGSAYANLAWILHPGLYPHGLAVSNGAMAYLLPGIYWIGGGGVDIGGGGSIVSIAVPGDANVNPSLATWGGGVMFYNSKLPAAAGGPFTLNSNGAVMKLQPLNLPSTDPNHIFNSIVIYQDRTVTTSVTLNGSASSTQVMGIIYVPGGQIKLNGNGGTLIVDQIIADTYDINGNGGTIKVMRGTGIDAVIVAAGLVD